MVKYGVPPTIEQLVYPRTRLHHRNLLSSIPFKEIHQMAAPRLSESSYSIILFWRPYWRISSDVNLNVDFCWNSGNNSLTSMGIAHLRRKVHILRFCNCRYCNWTETTSSSWKQPLGQTSDFGEMSNSPERWTSTSSSRICYNPALQSADAMVARGLRGGVHRANDGACSSFLSRKMGR